jgi:hypothetical protein
MIGDTTVSMTVLTDGSVGDVAIIGRASQTMDEATLNALNRWRFIPARCGTEPVVSDFIVMESFRLVADYRQTNSLSAIYSDSLTIMAARGPLRYFPLTSWHELRQ